MANKEAYTKEQVIEGIKNSGGVKAQAAAQLGCTRQTIDNYCDRYIEVKAAFVEERERLIDVGETKLFKLIKDEKNVNHWKAVQFLLRTIGRHRGYNESVEFSLSGGLGDALDIDLGKLDKSELGVLKNLLDKAKREEENE